MVLSPPAVPRLVFGSGELCPQTDSFTMTYGMTVIFIRIIPNRIVAPERQQQFADVPRAHVEKRLREINEFLA
jgi:hypothetical protein